VTLCIAAACQYRNKPRIITCTDWKVSSSFGSAENADKLRWIKKPNWVALTAGGATASDALVRMYRQSLSSEEITEENALGVFTRVAHDRLAQMKNAHVVRTLGVTYDHLRSKGKKELPESVVLDVYRGLLAINLDASLIVAGFVPVRQAMKPLICRIPQNCDVSISDHFECIGSGSVIARPTLLRRSYSSDVSLMEAAYRVFEAKKLSEVIDSVGGSTSLDVLFPDGYLEQLSDKGHDRMHTMFKRFGPKSSILKPRLEEKYFDSLEFSSLH
jgi:20S proteasome alpha/beta subunit